MCYLDHPVFYTKKLTATLGKADIKIEVKVMKSR